MKKIFKVLFLIFILSFINKVSADVCTDNILIENKCTTSSCYWTEKSYVWFNDEFYILENIEIEEINNFQTWFNLELKNNIIDKYNWEFTIEDFCTSTEKNDCEDKSFNLNNIINYNDNFIINWWFFNSDKSYSDWKHYFFTNYNTILTELKWVTVNLSLSDIIFNLKNYENLDNKNKYSIKNICIDSSCEESKYLFFYWDDINSYKILKWTKMFKKWENYSIFDFINVDVPYSHSKIKIWESVWLNFKFINNRPNTNCTESEYKYYIYYSYLMENGTESVIIDLFDDKINVDKDAKDITNPANGWVEYTKINSNNFLEVSFKESINTLKVWKIFFYIKIVKDWGKEIYKKINTLAIDVIGGNPIDYNSEIKFMNFDESQSYYKEDIFTSRIYLKDIALNSYSDDIYWIKISHPDTNLIFNWSTNNILNNLKSNTDIDWNNYFEFSYRFLQTGNYSKEFSLVIPKIDIDWNKTEENISFNIWNFSEKINIRPVIVSEIKNLRCSQSIKVIARCTWDDSSGCNWYLSEEKIFDNESFNWQDFRLTAQDNAGNKYEYSGIMDHVDRTAPLVEFIDLDFSSLKANESTEFKFKISDTHPGWCRDISKAKYKIFVNKDNGWYVAQGSEVEIDNIKTQIKEIEIAGMKHIFKESGDYKIKIVVEDAVWNTQDYIKEFNIYPTTENLKTHSSISSNTNWDKFANNSDFYTYTLKLRDKYWNPIYWKKIEYIKQDCTDYTNCKTLTENEISNSWVDVLEESWLSWYMTNPNWEIQIKVKSLSPWDFTERFKIKIQNWDNTYSQNGDFQEFYISNSSKNTFKKPVSWEISLDWTSIPEIWKDQKYKIDLINTGSLNNYSSWILNISETTVINNVSWHYWNTFDLINKDFDNNLNTYLSFSGSIDWIENLLKSPKIKTNNIKISYKLEWKNISYYLDNFEIGWLSCDFETLWVKVYWTLQWDWKWNITWQEENISDLSKWSLRSNIRRSAYKAIKNMSSWDIFNKIKYVEWDISISWNNLWYETLVVKDWNVTISWDLNTNNDTLGIIVLKNNYNVVSDYDNTWNIYIKKLVTEINAIIYADGAVRSANNSWTSYSDADLSSPLNLYWSLFTRNTIGWAVKWLTTYTLPWWKSTNDYNLAEKYDLNYIRKVPKTCDWNNTNDYSFIIKYNPSVQTNPPKLFGQ